MKIKYLALSVLACGALLSCSSDDDITAGGGGAADGETSYIAVNIRSVGDQGTRALPSGYEDGSDDENKINSIRFYLFDASGNAYTTVTNEVTGASSNYVDITTGIEQSEENNDETVSDVTNAILVFNAATGSAPASIVAIVNPNTTTLGSGALSLSELQIKTEQGLTVKPSETDYFIMSNSVYPNGGSKYCAVSLAGHVATTAYAANANPVDIYVERLAAKVTLSYSGNERNFGENPAYLVSGTDSYDNAVYAKVIGWAFAGTPAKTNLIKDIDASWTDDNLGFTADTNPWYNAGYHRSFWAKIPSATTIDESFVYAAIKDGPTRSDYTMENTQQTYKAAYDNTGNGYATGYTKVVVKAQLVDKAGAAKPRYVWATQEFTSKENVIAAFLSNNASLNQYYVQTGASDYAPLSATYLKFVSSADMSKATDTYRAYPQLDFSSLSETYKDKIFVKNAAGSYEQYNGTGTYAADGVNAVNELLSHYFVQIWTDGYCYYTTTIEHLGLNETPAKYGVVRNHSYKINITDITGFGTPVFDPTDSNEITPVPEVPTDDNSYISAQINVLSWRIVSNNVTLGGE